MNRRTRVLLAIAFTAMTASMIPVLMLRVSGNGEHHSNNAFVALVPIYAALVPIFIASGRRRSACANEKKNG